MIKVMELLFEECKSTRESGQKEYAHGQENAFRNFEALAAELDLNRKKILWIYIKKHLDGILAAINGHISQREPVRGRIKDAIVYLCLLEGMFEEDNASGSGRATTIQPMQSIQPDPDYAKAVPMNARYNEK